MPLSDIQTQIERLASKVLDRPVRDALIAPLPIFELKEVQDMATIQEALAALDGAVKGVAQRAADDHASLQAQIDALKAQGVDTAALQDAADKIEANVSALNAIDVPVPSDPSAPVADPASGGDNTPPAGDGGSTAPPADGGSSSAPADGGTTPDPAAGDGSAPATDAPAPDAGGSSDATGTVSDAPASPDPGLSAG